MESGEAPLPDVSLNKKPRADKNKATAQRDVEIRNARSDLKSQILLEPEDWFWAHWRENKPLQRVPRPFNWEKLLDEFVKMPFSTNDWVTHWRRNRNPPANWTMAEAQFWAEAWDYSNIYQYGRGKRSKASRRQLMENRRTQVTFDGNPDAERVAAWRLHLREHRWENIPIPYCCILSPGDLLLEVERCSRPWEVLAFFREARLPYLSEEELALLRKGVTERAEREGQRPVLRVNSYRCEIDPFYMVVASLGMHDLLLPAIKELCAGFGATGGAQSQSPFVASITQTVSEQVKNAVVSDQVTSSTVGAVLNRISNMNYPVGLPKLIMGLRDGGMVERYISSLRLTLCDSSEVIGWIAHTEQRRLDLVLNAAICASKDEDKDSIARILAKVEAPETARCMFALFFASKATSIAREWLERFPEYCFPLLLAAAASDDALGASAKTLLRELKRNVDVGSFGAEIVDQFHALGIEVKLDKDVEPSRGAKPQWLEQALVAINKERKSKLPAWVCSMAHDELIIDGYSLNEDDFAGVLRALQQSSDGKLHPLLEQARVHKPTEAVYDKFVLNIFQRWMKEGAPSKDKWAILSIGMLGSDALLFQLLPLMYQWRASGTYYHRAFYGLEAFRLSGSDRAVMKVNEIANTPSLRSLRTKALEAMNLIATDRGLSKDELEDRLILSCGLDSDGTCTLDFGSRKFVAMVGPDLQAVLRYPDGSKKRDLPEPGRNDDPQLSAQAKFQWQTMKKEIKDTAKRQGLRLEQSMITGRKWTCSEFRLLMLENPLMLNLAKMLIWAAYDHNGKQLRTFRVTEDRGVADENDRPTTIENAALIGIPHVFHLSGDLRERWRDVCFDYQIVAPFPQVGRTIYELLADEQAKSEVDRFAGISLPAIAIQSTLERRGWWRGSTGQGGYIYCHIKHYSSANITAVVEYDGYYIAMPTEAEEQFLKHCFFLPGILKPAEGFSKADAIQLGKVDPVIVSETLADLTELTRKYT